MTAVGAFRIVLLVFSLHVASSNPTNIYWTKDLLAGNGYHLRWNNADPEYLVFEMHAPVRGYLSVGFSPNGAMQGSDIVMAWVDSTSGVAYIKDLYAMGNSAPLEDDHNDYDLLWAEENETGTTVRFKRKWDTCDEKHDFEITEDTVRLIWAVSDHDPVNKNGIFQPAYHGVDFRGGKSEFLKIKTHLVEFPDDSSEVDPSIYIWDVRMKNVLVDGVTDTSYHCKIFKAPEFRDMTIKHQIIGYRTLFEEANKQWIHHINFFECSVPSHLGTSRAIFEKYMDHPGEQCSSRNMPPEWGKYCVTVPFVWVTGGEGLMLSEQGGIPLHEEHNGTTYFMMEIHYDNPKQITFMDNSGIRVFVTEKTRPNDYGSITVHARFGQFQMIPPKAVGFRNMAFCTSECTKSVLPPEGITITHATLHAHLIAKKLILRHIRDGVELPPIAQDLHYDFNYQQTRVVNPERKLLPGDIFMIECEYDTSDRDNITYGGTSTRDEMCSGYITYYPKVPLVLCKTQHDFYNFFDALGIKQIEGKHVLKTLQLPYRPTFSDLYDPGDDAYILKNVSSGIPEYPFDLLYVAEPRLVNATLKTVRDFVDSLDWTRNNSYITRKVWKQWWEGDHVSFCTGHNFKRIPLKDYIVKYPKYVPYQKPFRTSCDSSGAYRLNGFFGFTIFIALFLFLSCRL